MWSLAFPLNKSLWTSSYVWFTAGAAAVFLALCYALIDVRGWKAWAGRSSILGLNAIALFVLSGLGTKFLMNHKVTGPDGKPISLLSYSYAQWFAPLAEPINASLLFALANLAVLFVVLWVMDRKRLVPEGVRARLSRHVREPPETAAPGVAGLVDELLHRHRVGDGLPADAAVPDEGARRHRAGPRHHRRRRRGAQQRAQDRRPASSRTGGARASRS